VAPILAKFGYFAAIELARLECLLGDYGEALEACSPIKLGDRSELYLQLPSCHLNLYYHTGVCQMMLRRYADAIATFGDIALHVSRVMKPGSSSNLKSGVEQLMKKMSDKILALAAICSALCPGVRVDDQVRELMDNKWGEKMRRLQLGDIATFTDLFENCCPKFISPAVPDYSTSSNLVQDAFSNQVSIFTGEVQQNVAVLKLRSYLRLYASIHLDKLSRFSELTEDELVSQVLSYKHKMTQVLTGKRISTSDVYYYVQDGSLVINSVSTKTDKSKAAERYFVSGLRKHTEIISDVKRSFASAGL